MACYPLTLCSIYQARTVVWVCADISQHYAAPLCCVSIPQALLCEMKFAVSCGGEEMCSRVRKGRDFRAAVLPRGFSMASWAISAEGDP